MSLRADYLDRIVAAYHEYLAASAALELLEERLRTNPSFLTARDLRNRVARNLRGNLEGTYLIRLFAEFEAGLRDVWENGWHRTSEPPMRDLINASAAKRLIPQDRIDNVHRVRNWRNLLVHHTGTDDPWLTLQESQSHLCQFFIRLPRQW